MPRLRVLSILGLVAFALSLAAPGRAQVSSTVIDVVKVKGLVDPALDDFVRGAVRSAERAGATVVLQIDSLGGYGDRAARLGAFIHAATVPVVAWVGPTGSRAQGGALFLVYGASVAGMAPGAGLGPARPFDLGSSRSAEDPAEVGRFSSELLSLAPGAGADLAGVERLISGPALPAGPALEEIGRAHV